MADRVEGARRRLLAWYAAHQRPMPWRASRDPYAIWLSEVMLQQTRVETAIPYYQRFLARFPTVQALADADEQAVQASWAGLGYYRRARLMQQAAQQLVAEHGGMLPADHAALSALPGFGPYTSAAVASIAFGIPAAAVDGNVRRVLARYAGIEGDVTRGAAAKALAAEAARWPKAGVAGALTQALMELGATRCSPRRWRCEGCPLSPECVARQQGRQAALPTPKPRSPPTPRPLSLLLLTRGRRWLLCRQPTGGLFGGLWCPPFAPTLDELRDRWPTRGPPQPLGRFVHVLTHRRLEVEVFEAGLAPQVDLGEACQLATTAELDQLALPRFARRAFELKKDAT